MKLDKQHIHKIIDSYIRDYSRAETNDEKINNDRYTRVFVRSVADNNQEKVDLLRYYREGKTLCDVLGVGGI